MQPIKHADWPSTIHACSSGHLSLPLGAAEVGAVLFGQDLQVDPSDANGSIAIDSSSLQDMAVCFYTDGYLAGFDLPMEEIKISANCWEHQDILNLRKHPALNVPPGRWGRG